MIINGKMQAYSINHSHAEKEHTN